MTKRRPYLCPDGSEPCGRNGYCGHCPHDKNTKAKTVATDNTAVIRQLERERDDMLKERDAERFHRLSVDREIDEWKTMMGKVLQTMPVSEVARSCGTMNDAIKYFGRLHRERDELRDKYRTEQSLRAQAERGRIEAQTQLEQIRRGADMYGVMQSMALQGKKHPKEPPMDGRLDAIRSLVAHNAKLVAELAEMQRLYERASLAARDH